MMADPRQPLPNQGLDSQITTENTVIPVLKEQIHVASREVVTGEVQVHKHILTETVAVPLSTLHTGYREERVAVNRVVDLMPQPRYEGKNLIIPVVREEEVVLKRLVLVEEIHLIQETRTEERTERVDLRTEEATVTKVPLSKNSPAPLPE